MKPVSMVAIYFLFWVMSAFFVMPFGVRTHEEEGLDKVPGQAESAPAHFRPGRVALRATLLSAVAFALFYANFVQGWVTIEDITPFHPPAELTKRAY